MERGESSYSESRLVRRGWSPCRTAPRRATWSARASSAGIGRCHSRASPRETTAGAPRAATLRFVVRKSSTQPFALGHPRPALPLLVASKSPPADGEQAKASGRRRAQTLGVSREGSEQIPTATRSMLQSCTHVNMFWRNSHEVHTYAIEILRTRRRDGVDARIEHRDLAATTAPQVHAWTGATIMQQQVSQQRQFLSPGVRSHQRFSSAFY